jgi:hypothetical protein
MDSKERSRLNGGTVTGNAQQGQTEYYEETKNKSRNGEVEVCRRRDDGRAKQQECNAKHCDQTARDPDFPHD